jgi:hypothetical protein
MPENENKIDLQTELGVSRRDLLRRGAIVGGALLWVAPVIQSISPPAYATGIASGQVATCCACKRPNRVTGFQCGQDHFTQSACDDFCGGASNVAVYTSNAFCGPKKTCVKIT